MTVTYRKIAAVRRPDISGGSDTSRTGTADTSESRVRECEECSTRYEVDVRTLTTIQFVVSGPTCDRCRRGRIGPTASQPPGSLDAPAEERLIKVWWASQDTGALRLEARHVTREISTSIMPEVELRRPEVTDAATLAEAGWISTVAEVASAVLGELAWEVLASVWLGDYCEVLAALADVLDLIWSTRTPGVDATDRVVVRLSALPPVPAALIGDLVTRSFLARDRSPLPCAAADLRAVGMAVCAGTGHAADCACAERRAHRLVTGIDSYLFEESTTALGELRIEDHEALPNVPEVAHPPVEELPEPPDGPGEATGTRFSSPLLEGRQALRDARFGTPPGPQVFGR